MTRITEILSQKEIDLIKTSCAFVRGCGIGIKAVEVGDKVVRDIQFLGEREIIENVISFEPPKERSHEQ